MRFIGNKEPITNNIRELLEEEGLLSTKERLKLFDAFCGTGAVSDSLKNYFDLAINDMLTWCTVYTKGRLIAEICNFKKLGFDPFDYFNSNNDVHEGFFYNNYSPGGSNRMYFSKENAWENRLPQTYYREVEKR